MAETIRDQNSKLSDAAKTPRDTSERSKRAESAAKGVTAAASSATATSEQRTEQKIKKAPSKMRASFEGLDKGSKTLLIGNNSGYNRKDIQSARNAQKPSYESEFSSVNFDKNKNYSIMDNYSRSFVRDTSSSRLSRIVRDNMMFG